MTADSDVYTVETTTRFDYKFKKKRVASSGFLDKIKNKLRKHPELGKPLGGRLHGIWQVRMGPFRIWYRIYHIEKIVKLESILHKDEATKNY